MTNRPLLISDCDEVLMHMVVPFRTWLDENHAIHFDLESGNFAEALRHKECGSLVDGPRIWELLDGFFDSEMHRQYPVAGAVQAITHLQDIADVVVLTNLKDHRAKPRAQQLRSIGLDLPVYTNQGGKGEALKRILEAYQPSVAVFVDDLAHQHDSIAQDTPHVWRLHLVGEPILAPHISSAKSAHARIDTWTQAQGWVRDKLLGGIVAPHIERNIA